MKKKYLSIGVLLLVAVFAFSSWNNRMNQTNRERKIAILSEANGDSMYTKPSDEEIKDKLTHLQYEVTQNGGTEQPFANEYWDLYEPGIYVDIVTGEPLFLSTTKFKSGTGWPSFTQPISINAVNQIGEGFNFFGIEIKSTIGDSHLGHVFNDGPEAEGGLRYCMNSAAMTFVPQDQMASLGYGDYMDDLETTE